MDADRSADAWTGDRHSGVSAKDVEAAFARAANGADSSSGPHRGRFSGRTHPMVLYFRLIKRLRWLILLAWLAVIPVGVIYAPRLFNVLKDDLHSSPGSPSAVALQYFEQDGFCYSESAVVQVSRVAPCPECSSIVEDPWVENLFTQIDQEWCCSDASYFRFDNNNDKLAAPMFVTPDGDSTIMLYFGWYGTWWTKNMLSIIDGLNNRTSEYSVTVTSRSALDNANSGSATSDLGRMDAVSIPLALLVLAWRVRSLPLMTIPLLTLPVTLLASFSIVYKMATLTDFPTFGPALFVSTAVAMSFDWALFLLTRYRECVAKGLDNEACVRETMRYAGHTVLMSGVTLCISYGALIAFPASYIRTIGEGASVTLGMCMVVNLTLLPALLLVLPSFYRLEVSKACCVACWTCRQPCCRRSKCCRRRGNGGDVFDDTPLLDDGSAAGKARTRLSGAHELAAAIERLRKQQSQSVWYRVADLVRRHPWKFIVGTLVIGSPMTYASFHLKYTMDQNQLHPRNIEPFGAWMKFTRTFASGLTWPYALIAQPAPNATMADASRMVEQNNKLIAAISERLNIPATNFSGPSWVAGVPVSLQTGLAYLVDVNSPLYDTPKGYLSRLRNYECPHFSLGAKAIYTEIDTPFDPQGAASTFFITEVRDVIAQYDEPGVMSFHLALGLTEMYDMTNDVFGLFPVVVGATIGVMLILIAVAFRSLVNALRLVFTLALTLSWCFGGAVIVFQTSLFNWAGVYMPEVSALFWMGPILCFSLVCGLALDYDLFLFLRIREFRQAGFTTEAAIIKGYFKTGGVITTAGVIMVLAFGTLMLSSQLLLVQCGFLLSFSVLLDTFVVRSLLVPAIMFVLGERVWWPSAHCKQLPPPTRDELDVTDDVAERTATVALGSQGR